MKLPLAYYGQLVLRQKASIIKEINQEIHQLAEDMFETMQAHDGCGLAAPQVHRSIAMFITCIPRYDENNNMIPGVRRVFINPKIISYSPEVWTCQEGCLSIPGLREEVSRPFKVTIQALDLNGKEFTEEFFEFEAHVIMHENDHLNGVLYIDRISSKRKKAIEPKLKEIKKKYT